MRANVLISHAKGRKDYGRPLEACLISGETQKTRYHVFQQENKKRETQNTISLFFKQEL
jgi:hypothetical protein